MDHLKIDALTAGHIADAKDWKFSDVTLTTKDGSTVELLDSTDVTGIPTHPGSEKTKTDASAKSFKEQDKS